MRCIGVLLFLISPIFTYSQKRLSLVHYHAFTYYDYQENTFCVLDDSSFVWKYVSSENKWKKSPIELHIDMPFVQFIESFNCISDKGSPVYFVAHGCGVVYAKRGNVIERDDNSFYHKNQFGGSFFMDEGSPMIYGGYGLFTYKNIITRYDTIAKEWFMVETLNENPPIGESNKIIKYGYKYYLFNGYKPDKKVLVPMEEVYVFNKKTKKWSNPGKLNPKINREQMPPGQYGYQVASNRFSCFNNWIIEYDFEKIKYRKYKFSSTNLYHGILKVDSQYLIHQLSSKPSRWVEIKDKDFLKSFEYEEGDLIIPEKAPSLLKGWHYAIIGIVLFIIIWGIIKIRLKKINLKEEFVMRIKAIQEINQQETELIALLLNHHEFGLEISKINDLVNYENPSVDTLKKRREILLKELRYKLSSKYNVSKDDIFIELRMDTDKRMKLIFLNQEIYEALTI